MSLRRGLSITAKILAGVLLVAALAVGGLAWRLAAGHPLHLTFLVPTLQRSLASADPKLRLAFDDIIFAWVPGSQPPGLRVVGLRAYAADGSEVVAIREVGFGISLAALVHGRLAPSSIDVRGPAIKLRRDADGTFTLLGAGGSVPSAEPAPTGSAFFDELLAPPDPKKITGYLREVKITGGSLTLDDRMTEQVWHAPEIDLDVMRAANGIEGRLSAALAELGDPARVDADFSLLRASRSLQVKLAFRDIEVSALAALRPGLTPAAGSRLKIAGRIETTLAGNGRLGEVVFKLSGGPGAVDLPGTLAAPLSIDNLSLSGRLPAGLDRLAIDSLTLALGKSTIEAHADVSGLAGSADSAGEIRAQGNAEIRNLPVSDLPRLWPLDHGKSSGGRDWVAGQLEGGTISQAQASWSIAFPRDDPGAIRILAFGGSFDASGVRLHYLRPLPPIEDAAASAQFDAASLVVNVRSGGVGDLKIDKARVTIAGLNAPDQTLDLEGDVAGPLRVALALVDDPSLGYLRGTGINPADSGGRVAATLRLGFPLLKTLPLASIHASVKAQITQASLDKLIAGKGLSDGDIELALDEKGILATGRARLSGLPATLRWEESFAGRQPLTRIAVHARPEAADLAELGVDLQGVVQGPIAGEIVYSRYSDRPAELAIDADLTGATIALRSAHWNKPAGMPGRARATLELAGLKPSRISSFDLEAGDAAAQGRGQFGPEGELREVAFDRLTLGKTRLTGVVLSLWPHRIDARIGGGEFDAGPYLDQGESLGVRGSEPESGTAPAGPLAYALQPSRLSRVLLGAGREIDSLRLDFAYDGAHFDSINAEGSLLGGGNFTMHWRPDGPAVHRLAVGASDAGAALKALGIFDSAAGGTLTLSGTSQDNLAHRPIRGHLEISEYRLLGQSALWRLLAVATLTGVADMMTGDGLLMRRLSADYTKTDGRVDVLEARTFGPSLAITAKGNFDLIADTIAINGSVVPANALNSLVGRVPLIGFLITGGQGGGIGSVTYTATGRLSHPNFAVNPLSALDPGFLRALFDLGGSGGSGSNAQ
jgi:hypothetical protein